MYGPRERFILFSRQSWYFRDKVEVAFYFSLTAVFQTRQLLVETENLECVIRSAPAVNQSDVSNIFTNENMENMPLVSRM